MSDLARSARRSIPRRSSSLSIVATTLALGLVASVGSAGPVAPTEGVEASALATLLEYVPGDVISAVLVPNLKRASDDLAECIARMDRPQTGLMGRPIDQLKAQLGLGTGVDDKGSLALWFEPAAPDVDPASCALIPVNDATEFLEGNFERAVDAGEDAWRTGEGEIVHARAVERWVLLSASAKPVREYDAGTGFAEPMRAAIGERGMTHVPTADVIAWAGPDALARMLADAESAPLPGAAGIPAVPPILRAVGGDLTSGLVLVDLDPLGVGTRFHARFRPESRGAELAAGAPSDRASLARVPMNPYYVALSIDVAGLGGGDKLTELAAASLEDGDSLPTWMSALGPNVRGIEFALYPSRLGIALGGLLNDSSIVVETDTPAEFVDGMREWVESMPTDQNGITMTGEWVANKPLRTGGAADAFQVKFARKRGVEREVAQQAMAQEMINNVLFGSRGFNGFVGAVRDAFVLVGSQRPDVWTRAKDAAGGRAGTLMNDQIVVAMRPWLLEDPDVEGYVGIGQFGRLVEQLMQLGPIAGAFAPSIPESTPPIGFALEIEGGEVDGAMVMPAEVLALVLDSLMEQITGALQGAGPGAGRGAR